MHQSRPPRWRLDRGDWDLFTALSTPVSSFAEMPSCDKATQYFNLVLHAAAILSVPKTYGRFRKRLVPWWNAAPLQQVTIQNRKNGLLQ